jgi:large subunit ribosomal protein L17
MRHRVKTKKLNKNKSHREALLRNLAKALILRKSIITTSARAKETKKFAEKLISFAKKNEQNSQRRIFHALSDKKVVKKLFEEIVPQLDERAGGYVRLIKTGKRKGDGADMSLIEFILVPKKEEKKAKVKAKGKAKVRIPRLRKKRVAVEKKTEKKEEKAKKPRKEKREEKPKKPKKEKEKK